MATDELVPGYLAIEILAQHHSHDAIARHHSSITIAPFLHRHLSFTKGKPLHRPTTDLRPYPKSVFPGRLFERVELIDGECCAPARPRFFWCFLKSPQATHSITDLSFNYPLVWLSDTFGLAVRDVANAVN